jgi:hypothetical protein
MATETKLLVHAFRSSRRLFVPLPSHPILSNRAEVPSFLYFSWTPNLGVASRTRGEGRVKF